MDLVSMRSMFMSTTKETRPRVRCVAFVERSVATWAETTVGTRETEVARTGPLTTAANEVNALTREAAPRVDVVAAATARGFVIVVTAGSATGVGRVAKVRGGSEAAAQVKAGGDSAEGVIRA